MYGGSEFQVKGPKRVKARSPFVLYLQSGRFRRRVSALQRRDREAEYRCRILEIVISKLGGHLALFYSPWVQEHQETTRMLVGEIEQSVFTN